MSLKSIGTWLLFCLVFSPAKSQIEKAFGAQVGYSYSGINKFDAGSNYYFSWPTKNFCVHTLGVYTSLTGIFVNQHYHIGEQIGTNYHFTLSNWPWAFRLSPSFENNFDRDMRVGSDFGMSFLGVFVYAGYYKPVGSFESPYITRWRFGVRFILNAAPVKVIGWE